MLSFSGALKIYVALEACDMRMAFNGLYAAVSQHLGMNPQSGALFAFSNKRRTRLKILYWDGTGLWVLSKRLEKGSFSWPKTGSDGQKTISLDPAALAMLTDGIDLRDGCRRPWYQRE
jgi:transposase